MEPHGAGPSRTDLHHVRRADSAREGIAKSRRMWTVHSFSKRAIKPPPDASESSALSSREAVEFWSCTAAGSFGVSRTTRDLYLPFPRKLSGIVRVRDCSPFINTRNQ